MCPSCYSTTCLRTPLKTAACSTQLPSSPHVFSGSAAFWPPPPPPPAFSYEAKYVRQNRTDPDR
eukprot:scaffold194371_cov18-Tisochrysis_lutea.AAC.1